MDIYDKAHILIGAGMFGAIAPLCLQAFLSPTFQILGAVIQIFGLATIIGVGVWVWKETKREGDCVG